MQSMTEIEALALLEAKITHAEKSGFGHDTSLLRDYVSVGMLRTLLRASRWIPCSERLPKINEPVLVTRRLLGGQVLVSEAYRERDNHGWSANGQRWADEFVLAWRPRPEAYQQTEKRTETL